jgi:hypothetical protein
MSDANQSQWFKCPNCKIEFAIRVRQKSEPFVPYCPFCGMNSFGDHVVATCDTNLSEFKNELTASIIKHSLESYRDTPDDVLACYLLYCLKAWAAAVEACERGR